MSAGPAAPAASEREERASVWDVVAYFLEWDRERGPDADVTHQKLQGLLYYAQAWSLACTGAPLFDEPIHADPEGPIVRVVRERLGHVEGVLVHAMDAAP